MYYLYCREGSARGTSKSGSDVLLSKPYTGTLPDVLSRHEKNVQHNACASSYREGLECGARMCNINDVIHSEGCLTIDSEAFCVALHCLYFLAKCEIPYTTNFGPICDLCIQLGSCTLPCLLEGKNCTYGSEQSRQEMLFGTHASPLRKTYSIRFVSLPLLHCA